MSFMENALPRLKSRKGFKSQFQYERPPVKPGRLLLMLALVSAGMAVLLFVFYFNRLVGSMNDELSRYAKDLSRNICQSVSTKLDSELELLSATAVNYLERTPDEGMSYLQSAAFRCEYNRVWVVDTSGQGVSTDHRNASFARQHFYRQSMYGESNVQIGEDSVVEQTPCMLYAVPLTNSEGEIVGVLAAESSMEQFTDYLHAQTFGRAGYCVMMNSAGDFLTTIPESKPERAYRNLLSLVRHKGRDSSTARQMLSDLQTGKSNEGFFDLETGEEKFVRFEPVGKDWYLLSVVNLDIAIGDAGEDIWLSQLLLISILFFTTVLVTIVLRYQKKSRCRLQKLAFVDEVTGGLSHAKFCIDATRFINHAPAGTFAYVSMDMNKFQLLNDAFGHEQGDAALRYIYNCIADSLLPGELVARVCDDHFAVLMKNSGKEHIRSRLTKLVQQINLFNLTSKTNYYMSFSEGVYIIDDPKVEFLTIQDRAVSARRSNDAVHLGELSVCRFYSDSARQKLLRERVIENAMKSALADKEFKVYLQPKIGLGSGMVEGAEALVRWISKDGQFISPGEFIPLFERNGFVAELDLYVFYETCCILEKWMKQAYRLVPISVNLSRVHLLNPDFLDGFFAVFDQFSIPPRFIEFELTETVVYDNVEQLVSIIDAIHRRGFQCSLDDFGSGYSSLNTLKDVPVDVIKLDRAFFCENLENSPRAKAVVRSVLNLADKLNMQTVAEGVEKKAHLELLREAGCTYVQGWVYAPALPLEKFEALPQWRAKQTAI